MRPRTRPATRCATRACSSRTPAGPALGVEAMTGSGGGAERSGKGGRTNQQAQAGTGGYGRRRLEGKGPTPPAIWARPSGPAARRRPGGPARRVARRPGRHGARAGVQWKRFHQSGPGAGDAPEVVAGRNPVLESLRARVPASAVPPAAGLIRPAGDRRDPVAADAGIPLIEAGRPELDRLTGGAVHQGLALKIRPYDYAHPADLPGPGPGARRATTDRRPGLGHRPTEPGRDRPLGSRVRWARGCWCRGAARR